MVYTQKSKDLANQSSLLKIVLPSEALRKNGIFSIAAAKSVLEMEASSENVIISEVEVLTFVNPSGEKEVAIKSIENFKSSIRNGGFEMVGSVRDASYLWLTKNSEHFLVYVSASKKESNAYIGVANKSPDYLTHLNEKENALSNEPVIIPAQNSSEVGHQASAKHSQPNSDKLPPELVGNWCTLAGAKVNWRDESTGYMLVSGISKGYGLELKADGTFLQSTVVTSGRPNYRVFVSTTGAWQVIKDKIQFYPVDRHYRKWENEMIMVDEHSVPESYFMYWRKQINEVLPKVCLYLRYTDKGEEQELCNE